MPISWLNGSNNNRDEVESKKSRQTFIGINIEGHYGRGVLRVSIIGNQYNSVVKNCFEGYTLTLYTIHLYTEYIYTPYTPIHLYTYTLIHYTPRGKGGRAKGLKEKREGSLKLIAIQYAYPICYSTAQHVFCYAVSKLSTSTVY